MFYYISLIAAIVVFLKFGEIFNPVPTVPVNSHGFQLHSEMDYAFLSFAIFES